MPVALEEKIKKLLKSRLTPLKLQYLAKNVACFVKKQDLLQELKLKTPLGKATYLFNVADPLSVLNPREVHIYFLLCFVNNVTNKKYLNLKGHNLLIAR